MSAPHHSPKQRGWQAYFDGMACPYMCGDDRRAEWEEGWDLAKKFNHRGQ